MKKLLSMLCVLLLLSCGQKKTMKPKRGCLANKEVKKDTTFRCCDGE